MTATATLPKHASEAVTAGIRVVAVPRYLVAHSDPDEKKFRFAYRIRISNESSTVCTLMRRKWIIVTSSGKRREVEGEGVVGETPRLLPGASHEYESGCEIETSWGTMEGSYGFVNLMGEKFEVAIGRFYLVAGEPPARAASGARGESAGPGAGPQAGGR